MVHKVLQEERHVTHLQIAALAQFVCHISRYILRPFLGGVEGNHPQRAFVLAFEEVEDDGFEISGLDVSFAVDTAIATKLIDDKVYVLIVAFRSDLRIPWHLPQPTHGLDELVWAQWKTGEYWKRHRLERRRPGSMSRRIASRVNAIKGLDAIEESRLPWKTWGG